MGAHKTWQGKVNVPGKIAFGGISIGNVFGMGKIGIPSQASINNVLYAEGLKYNLLSISQF